jgi:hypothetical protein
VERSHGRTSEAPPDERGGYRYVRPTATVSHLDSTQRRRPTAATPDRLPTGQRPGNTPFGLTARRVVGKHVAMIYLRVYPKQDNGKIVHELAVKDALVFSDLSAGAKPRAISKRMTSSAYS